jgi:hypothetical protein
VTDWAGGLVAVFVLGVVFGAAGLGTWARVWYAPLLRRLNGVHPRWLGPAYTAVGVAAVLAACAGVAEPGPTRGTLVIWAADAVIVATGCLVVGLRIRGRRSRARRGIGG